MDHDHATCQGCGIIMVPDFLEDNESCFCNNCAVSVIDQPLPVKP